MKASIHIHTIPNNNTKQRPRQPLVQVMLSSRYGDVTSICFHPSEAPKAARQIAAAIRLAGKSALAGRKRKPVDLKFDNGRISIAAKQPARSRWIANLITKAAYAVNERITAHVPQAPDDLREQMKRWFGDMHITGPLSFLKSRGYTEKAGLIRPPLPSHIGPLPEQRCIDFLFQEWDFAYLDGY